jgi:multisubunit Na+/H+ antiporter MnhF subunit
VLGEGIERQISYFRVDSRLAHGSKHPDRTLAPDKWIQTTLKFIKILVASVFSNKFIIEIYSVIHLMTLISTPKKTLKS